MANILSWASIFISGLGLLTGFVLFFPALVFSIAQRRGIGPRWPVVVLLCLAFATHAGLEQEIDSSFQHGILPIMTAYRWVSLGTWIVRRDEFWPDAFRRASTATDSFEFLLRHGANPNRGLEEISRELSIYGSSPHTRLIGPLLRAGGNPDQSLFGKSLFSQLLHGKQFDVAQTLMEAGAHTFHERLSQNQTTLHLAARHGAPAAFLRRLADCLGPEAWTDQDAHGRMPIHELSTTEQLTLFASESQRLMASGRDGGTLLHYAVERRHTGIYQALLELGFSPDTLDAGGCSPLGWAPDFATFTRMRVQASSSAPLSAPTLNRLWTTALRSGDADFVATLLREGADPKTALPGGNAPLHEVAALWRGHVLIPLLASAGAALEALNLKNETPLLTALRERNATAAGLLLDLGANPWIRTQDGRTTTQLAQEALAHVKSQPRNLSLNGFKEEWAQSRPWEELIQRLEHATRLAEVELPGDETRVPPLPGKTQPTRDSDRKTTSESVDQLCPSCSGSGNCQTCYGRGEITDYSNLKCKTCPSCRGNGRCTVCKGKGRVKR